MDVSKFNDAYFAKIKAKKAKTADGAPPALLSSYPSYPFLPIPSSFLAASQTVSRSIFLFRPNFEDQEYMHRAKLQSQRTGGVRRSRFPVARPRRREPLTVPRRRAQASSRRRTRRSR